jgi:hypothetical protein
MMPLEVPSELFVLDALLFAQQLDLNQVGNHLPSG